jgi:hypothetical protein
VRTYGLLDLSALLLNLGLEFLDQIAEFVVVLALLFHLKLLDFV